MPPELQKGMNWQGFWPPQHMVQGLKTKKFITMFEIFFVPD